MTQRDNWTGHLNRHIVNHLSPGFVHSFRYQFDSETTKKRTTASRQLQLPHQIIHLIFLIFLIS